MAFTRDDIAAYEKQVPTEVADTTETLFQPQDVKTEDATQESTASVEEPSTETETPVTAEGDTSDGSTDVTAESSTATAEPEGEAEPETEVPVKGSARDRIEDLVAERNALRKYGDYLLKQLESRGVTTQPTQDVQAPVTAPKAAEDPEPRLEDYEYDPNKFAKAQNDWNRKQIQKGVQEEVAKFKEAQQAENVRNNFEGRVAEFRKDHSDFDVVISNPALPRLAPLAARTIVQAEQGPEIAYHLAKNPDLATRIARMTAEQQLMAIGRVQEQLNTAKTKTTETPVPVVKTAPKRTVTQAPPPPKPVNTGTSVSTPVIITMQDFVHAERARKASERQAKKAMIAKMR